MARSNIEQSRAGLSQGSGSLQTQNVRARASDFLTVSERATQLNLQGLGNLKQAIGAVMNEAETQQQKQFKIEQSIWLNKEAAEASVYWNNKVKAGDVAEDFDTFTRDFEGWQNERLSGIDDETRARFIGQTESMRSRIFIQHQNKVATLKSQDGIASNQSSWAGMLGLAEESQTPQDAETIKQQVTEAVKNLPTEGNLARAEEAVIASQHSVAKNLPPEQAKAYIEKTDLDPDDRESLMQSLQDVELTQASISRKRVLSDIGTLQGQILDISQPKPPAAAVGMLQRMATGTLTPAQLETAELELNEAYNTRKVMQKATFAHVVELESFRASVEKNGFAGMTDVGKGMLIKELDKSINALRNENASIPLNKQNPDRPLQIEVDAQSAEQAYFEALSNPEIDSQTKSEIRDNAINANQLVRKTRVEVLARQGIGEDQVDYFTPNQRMTLIAGLKVGDPSAMAKIEVSGGWKSDVVAELTTEFELNGRKQEPLPIGMAYALNADSPDVFTSIAKSKSDLIKGNQVAYDAEALYTEWDKASKGTFSTGKSIEIMGGSVDKSILSDMDNKLAGLTNTEANPDQQMKEVKSAIFGRARALNMLQGVDVNDALKQAQGEILGKYEAIDTGNGKIQVDISSIPSGVSKGKIEDVLQREKIKALSINVGGRRATKEDITSVNIHPSVIMGNDPELANLIDGEGEKNGELSGLGGVIKFAKSLREEPWTEAYTKMGERYTKALDIMLNTPEGQMNADKLAARINAIEESARYIQRPGYFELVYDGIGEDGITTQVAPLLDKEGNPRRVYFEDLVQQPKSNVATSINRRN